MTAEEKVVSVNDARPQSDDEKLGRSTIEFPYTDLDDAIQIVAGVHAVGGTGCDIDQLAAHLKQSAKGGGFRLRLIGAKQFGLMNYARGEIVLTDLGKRINDQTQTRQARVDAFLAVPLYKAVYDKFRGVNLPPTAGLERKMQNLGVTPKQKDKARQVFMRSAKSAGFFELSADRLVIPSGLNQTAPKLEDAPPKDRTENKPSGGGGGGGNNLHPFIQGLLAELPAAKSEWSMSARAEWLQAAEQLFKLIYAGAGDGSISVKFESSTTKNA